MRFIPYNEKEQTQELSPKFYRVSEYTEDVIGILVDKYPNTNNSGLTRLHMFNIHSLGRFVSFNSVFEVETSVESDNLEIGNIVVLRKEIFRYRGKIKPESIYSIIGQNRYNKINMECDWYVKLLTYNTYIARKREERLLGVSPDMETMIKILTYNQIPSSCDKLDYIYGQYPLFIHDFTIEFYLKEKYGEYSFKPLDRIKSLDWDDLDIILSISDEINNYISSMTDEPYMEKDEENKERKTDMVLDRRKINYISILYFIIDTISREIIISSDSEKQIISLKRRTGKLLKILLESMKK